MTSVPPATAVTSPDWETVPTLGVNEAHVTVGEERAPPAESFATTRACEVCPTASVEESMETAGLATGGLRLTLSVARPAHPARVALIPADPTSSAVTRPSDETEATAAFSDVQLTLPDTGVASRGVITDEACAVSVGASVETLRPTATL